MRDVQNRPFHEEAASKMVSLSNQQESAHTAAVVDTDGVKSFFFRPRRCVLLLSC